MTNENVGEQQAAPFIAQLQAISPEFTKAVIHVARSVRGQYIEIARAVEEGGIPAAVAKLEALRESPIIVGITSKLLSIADKATALIEQIQTVAPILAPIVIGLTVVGAGFFVAKTAAVLGMLLILAGACVALYGASKLFESAASQIGV